MIDDPVHSCELYRDKAAGGCAHVDGMLCDMTTCSSLIEYKQRNEGMTIKDDPKFRDDLRKMMLGIRGKSGPFPYA